MTCLAFAIIPPPPPRSTETNLVKDRLSRQGYLTLAFLLQSLTPKDGEPALPLDSALPAETRDRVLAEFALVIGADWGQRSSAASASSASSASQQTQSQQTQQHLAFVASVASCFAQEAVFPALCGAAGPAPGSKATKQDAQLATKCWRLLVDVNSEHRGVNEDAVKTWTVMTMR